MPDEMEEIISEFITEAEEALDKMDNLFVEIETKGYDKDVLNEIFRTMHTIKGGAGFLGFKSIVDVAHGAENILKKLREGGVSLSKQLIDVVLKSADMLRLILHHIKLKDEKIEDTSPLLKELEEALKAAQSQSTIPPTPHPPLRGEGGDESPDSGHPILSFEGDRAGDEEVVSQTVSDTYGDRIIADRKESIQTLRVDISRIDKVMDLTGEVVLIRNRLLNIVNYLETKYSDDPYLESLFETVSFLDLVTSDMQLAVMKMRMQPIQKIFSKFPRLVRDVSGNLGKNVELKISGEDTEVDKSVIEYIADPLVHMIRNAIDHGIESVDERRLKEKPEKGTVEINAYQRGNQIIIEVSDDGMGIDAERIKRKALEKALITEDEAMRVTDDEAINLIFLPGVSTAEVATELSGRGVGMDVVKTNISKLSGYVEVKTKKDRGAMFRISIPLTLAVIHVLMVRTGNSRYAIPLIPIEETLKVSRRDVKDISRQKVVVIRDRVIPVIELSDIVGNSGYSESDYRYIVVISIGEKRFCIAVDELLGQEEIVIKNIEGINTDLSCVLGSTITGDGKVVLILDLAGISRNKLGVAKV